MWIIKLSYIILKMESNNQRSRYIELRFHKIKEFIKEEKIKLEYVKFQNSLADCLTKYLNESAMKQLRNILLRRIKEY